MSKRKRSTRTRRTAKATAAPGSSPKPQGKGSPYFATFMSPRESGSLSLSATDQADAEAQVRERYPEAMTITVTSA